MSVNLWLRIRQNSWAYDSDILPVVEKLDKISDAYHVDFVLSVSKDENELPDSLKSKIVVSL